MKVIRRRPSIQPSESRLLQVKVPTEIQHHSCNRLTTTSAQQGSPDWGLFINIQFCGQPILKHLRSYCQQPAPTQSPALSIPESLQEYAVGWKKQHQEPKSNQMNTQAVNRRDTSLPFNTKPSWCGFLEGSILVLPLTLPRATPENRTGQ